MSLHFLITKFLWLLPLILQGSIALAMMRRNLVTTFPFFFTYTTVVLATGLVLIFWPYGHRAYSSVYWSSETLAILLGFAVIFETLGLIFPSAASLRFVLNLFWALGTVAALIALLIFIWAGPGAEGNRALEVIVLAERSLRFLQASLLVIVIALMSRLGLTWRDESVGITAGFGVYSALALIVYEFGYHLHQMSSTVFVLLNSAAYNVATMIWAFYILRPVRVTPVERLPTTDLAEWNGAVNDYVNQWSRRY